jgi:hypothetical protein
MNEPARDKPARDNHARECLPRHARAFGRALAFVLLTGAGTPSRTAAESAEKLREEKHLLHAREALLRCARETCPKIVRVDCLKWIAEVEAAQPTVVIRARDAGGHDLVDARVTLDGEVVASGLDGHALALDPGPHELRVDASSSGLEVRRETFVVSEGEKNRVVLVTLSLPVAPPPAASQAPTSVVVAPAPAPMASSSPWPWIAGGVGAAGLATFVVFQLIAHSAYSDLEKGCGVTSTCPSRDVDPVRTKLVISGVGLGVGVLGIGAAAVLLATSPSSSISVTPTAGGATVGWRARF